MWIPFHTRMLLPGFVEISPANMEKGIFKSRQCIFAISLLSPLGKECNSSFEQAWIPFTYIMLSSKIGLL